MSTRRHFRVFSSPPRFDLCNLHCRGRVPRPDSIRAPESWRIMVGAVGTEIASLTFKSFNSNGVAPPPYSNWSLMEPSTGAYPKRLFMRLL